MATPVEWLNEFQVNTGTAATGAQSDSHIIGLSNGNILVAWEESASGLIGTSTGIDIIGKIYDAEGNVVRDSFQLNTARDADDEGDFDVAATNDGGFVLVFVDDSILSVNRTSIRWEMFGATGNLASNGTLADEFVAADFLANPQVAVNQLDNSFIVTYTDSVGADTDVRARYVTAAGVAGTEFDAAQNGPDFDGDGDVAILANGNIVSVYEEFDVGISGIEFSIRTPAGVSVLTGVNVSTGTNIDPQVTALANGNFVVVWHATDTGNGNIEYQVFSPTGAPVAARSTTSVSLNNENEPEVVALPDGGFVMVWDDDTDNLLVAQRLNANGSFDGARIIVENVGTTTPNIGVTGDGRILFTWAAEGGELYASIWDPRQSTINASDLQQGLRNFVDAGVITSNVGATTVVGAGANDSIIGSVEGDSLTGGPGADAIFGRDGADVIGGGVGQDTLAGNSGNDNISGGDSGDRLFGGNGIDTLKGDGGDDNILGGNQGDLLVGGNGVDTLKGEGGNDSILGGNQGDLLIGGDGVDTLKGEGGNDSILGGNQNDKLFGGGGVDTLDGGIGNDSLLGGDNNDVLLGGTGNDTLRGEGGNDSLVGGLNNDNLFGGNGIDTLVGQSGDDRLFGGNQNDELFGGAGRDTLKGDGGADTLTGSTGNDQLFGGANVDTAAYTGAIGRYNITDLGAKIRVVDTLGNNGVDLLSSIERLKFGNTVYTVAQALSGNGAQNAAPTANGRDISSPPAGFDTGAEALRAEASGLTADDLLV